MLDRCENANIISAVSVMVIVSFLFFILIFLLDYL